MQQGLTISIFYSIHKNNKHIMFYIYLLIFKIQNAPIITFLIKYNYLRKLIEKLKLFIVFIL